MPKNEKKFHKETTIITPGKDIKDKKTNVGKDKEHTTVFSDDETENI